MWSSLQKKYRGSVFYLEVVSASYSPERPYASSGESASTGSGFVVSKKLGLVVTNAHVVENCVSIIGRCPYFPGKDLTLRLISISREKDLALLQLTGEDLLLLPESVEEMKLGNSFEVSEMQEVVAIGYPLGQDGIKFTQGVISGFQSSIDEEDELTRVEDTSTFIQITCPINKGNSGGPLLNNKGEVVGVCAAGVVESQNVGYAIPVNTLLSILPQLKKGLLNEDECPSSRDLEKMGISTLIPFGGIRWCTKKGCSVNPLILKQPRFGLEWCTTNEECLRSIFGKKTQERGVLVTYVWKDTIFEKEIEVGDLLTSISVTTPRGTNGSSTEETKIYGEIDNTGTTSFVVEGRSFGIKDFIDCCLYSGKLTVTLLKKNGEMLEVEADFVPSCKEGREMKYCHFEKCEYLITGGMCLIPLSYEVCSLSPELRRECYRCERFKDKVLISQIFGGSEVSSVGSLKEGTLLTEVCGEEVKTLGDVAVLIGKAPSFVTFKDWKGNIFVTSKQKILSDTDIVKRAYTLM